jgi:hypothetical protein
MDTFEPTGFTPDAVYRLAFGLALRHIEMVSPDEIGSDPTTQLDALIATVGDEINSPPEYAEDLARGVGDALAGRG